MCSASNVQKIIQSVAGAYRSVFGNDVVQIILYGSYARGDFTDDSDLDLAAIVVGPRRELQQKLKQVWDISSDLELEYGIIISPVVIPYDEYMKYKDDVPYYRNISREGVNIVA